MSLDPSHGILTLLRREARTIVVADLVESVHLYELDEQAAVQGWQTFVGQVLEDLLPRGGGRLVKSLGDGLMLEFADAPSAVACAGAMHALMEATDDGPLPMRLRVGVHVADIWADQRDIYGSGVNLAARITTLAGPGETVVSAEVRERLADGLDGTVEDLGPCYLKHVAAPVRSYRIGRQVSAWRVPAGTEAGDPSPTVPSATPSIAVIPFELLSPGATDGADDIVGELIADSVIAQLSRSPELTVLSRLTTTALRRRSLPHEHLRQQLHAVFVLTGTYLRLQDRLVVQVELADLRDGRVVWADRMNGSLEDLMQPESELVHDLAQGTHGAILDAEVQRSLHRPLPTLESFTLLIGAVSLMHRQSRHDFGHARRLLEHLGERFPRSAMAKAWLAKWYAVCAAQQWSDTPERNAAQARAVVERALDLEPCNALAWSIKGLLHSYIDRDIAHASAAFDEALRQNPNEPLAWLYAGMLHGWRGQAEQAVAGAEAALCRSPLDPMRYYFDSLAAGAMLGAKRYDDAVRLAQRSIRLNAEHVATYKVLTISQALAGDGAGAAETARRLLARQPGFTVASFMAVSPWAMSPDAPLLADALAEAGVPRA